MNRVIKFRAWDGNTMSAEFGFSERHTTFDDCKSYRTITQESEFWTLMQFTGLLDNNGVEIYEGDIVKNKKGVIGKVDYSERGTRFGLHSTKPHYITGEPHSKYYSLIGCEIIGNTYENPKLLKVES